MRNRKRILVIDDSRALASATERILRTQDFEVIKALDEADGYGKAKEEKPDVIILDAVIPGINGYEVGRQLKQDHETFDIPIIILGAEDVISSEGGTYEINMAFECGANDYLQQPVDATELIRSVKNVLWFSTISAMV